MELEEIEFGLAVGVAFAIGLVLSALVNWYRNKSPEILQIGVLEDYGLPIHDSRFSRIFTHSKSGRIAMATLLLEEVTPQLDADSKKIRKSLNRLDSIRHDLNVIQDQIRDMDTEGEQMAFSKTHLTPFLGDLRMEGELLGAALSSKTSIWNQILFLNQVVQGHERLKVQEILEGGPFEKVDEEMLVDQALRSFRDALTLDSSEARKTFKLWLELKS